MTTRGPNIRRVQVIQGEAKVDAGDDVVLTTLLGSCVSCCMHDPIIGVGGINHFLLPGSDDIGARGRAQSYGVYLMELLVNELLKRGADRRNLKAKLFGGARTMEGLSDIGAQNVRFAKEFLTMENIAYVGGDVGGNQGRRIEYWPGSGRARQILMQSTIAPSSIGRQMAAVPMPSTHGELELF